MVQPHRPGEGIAVTMPAGERRQRKIPYRNYP